LPRRSWQSYFSLNDSCAAGSLDKHTGGERLEHMPGSTACCSKQHTKCQRCNRKNLLQSCFLLSCRLRQMSPTSVLILSTSLFFSNYYRL